MFWSCHKIIFEPTDLETCSLHHLSCFDSPLGVFKLDQQKTNIKTTRDPTPVRESQPRPSPALSVQITFHIHTFPQVGVQVPDHAKLGSRPDSTEGKQKGEKAGIHNSWHPWPTSNNFTCLSVFHSPPTSYYFQVHFFFSEMPLSSSVFQNSQTPSCHSKTAQNK